MKPVREPQRKQSLSRTYFFLCAVAIWFGVCPPCLGDSDFREDQILIKPRTSKLRDLNGFHAAQGVTVLAAFPRLGGIQVLRLREGSSVESTIAEYSKSGLVEYAEPDHVRRLAVSPNDPKFLDGTLWGLNNTGQSGGTPDADIDAPEAWDLLTSASNIVVAVLDTGVRYTHEDLATNMWVNPEDGGHGLTL
jgi:subtilisin family serine protease